MIKPKILIIDDEKDFLNFLKEELELQGYEVFASLNGEDGIRQIKEFKPDLVICDIKMPRQDGFYVLKELRRSGDTKMPFIMLTAFTDFDKTRKAYAEEADLYLTKPVKIPLLLKNIKLLLALLKQKI